jgi:hypothetical protein
MFTGLNEFDVLALLAGDPAVVDPFNYFFTLTSIFGAFAFVLGLMCRILSRS